MRDDKVTVGQGDVGRRDVVGVGGMVVGLEDTIKEDNKVVTLFLSLLIVVVVGQLSTHESNRELVDVGYWEFSNDELSSASSLAQVSKF